MKRPIIGIIGRPDINDRKTPIINVFDVYRKAINEVGGNAILILPPQNVIYENVLPKNVPSLTEEEKEMLIDQIKLCDGFLLPGGFKMYEYDCFVVDYLIEHNYPVLGICMGMQVLAAHEKRKISNQVQHTLKNVGSENHYLEEGNHTHPILLKKQTRLYNLFKKDQINVNSFHNYHVPDALGFTISAVSTDGYIEAIEYPSKDYVLGVQWHPEKMLVYQEEQRIIFQDFINVCKKGVTNE